MEEAETDEVARHPLLELAVLILRLQLVDLGEELLPVHLEGVADHEDVTELGGYLALQDLVEHGVTHAHALLQGADGLPAIPGPAPESLNEAEALRPVALLIGSLRHGRQY